MSWSEIFTSIMQSVWYAIKECLSANALLRAEEFRWRRMDLILPVTALNSTDTAERADRGTIGQETDK